MRASRFHQFAIFIPLGIVFVAAALFLFPACGGGGDDDDDATGDDDDQEDEVFDPKPEDFKSEVDNTFFPLVVGSLLKYAGNDGTADVLLEVEVLADTATIAEIECAVQMVTRYENLAVVSITRNCFAEEIVSNDVYCFGQDVDQYTGEEVTGHSGSWRVDGNAPEPGLVFEGDPAVGDQWSPVTKPNEGDNVAEVVEMDGAYTASVAQDFTSGVLTLEVTNIATGDSHTEFYAPDFGLAGMEFDGGGIPLISIEGL